MPASFPQTCRTHTEDGHLHAMIWAPDKASEAMTPLVLFHDSLGCTALWRDFPEQLATATGRQVIAYDRLGFGQSDVHPSRLAHTFIHDEAVIAFRALHQQLDLNAFIALGHSVGGAMATECATNFGDQCKGLITESSQAFVEEYTLRGIRQARENFSKPGQLERLQKYHGDKAAWVLSAWIDTWLDHSYQDWALDDVLRRVQCPMLVMHGEQDEFGTAEHSQRFASLPSGPVTMKLLTGVGHVPHREDPSLVIGLIRDFLTQHNI